MQRTKKTRCYFYRIVCHTHKQSKVSLGKYTRDHLTFDWRMYFSRPIRFSPTLVCGLFKNPWFSCRRYFKVPLPILLAASPLAPNGFAAKTLIRAHLPYRQLRRLASWKKIYYVSVRVKGGMSLRNGMWNDVRNGIIMQNTNCGMT